VGSLQALEALKLLAGFGEPLVGRLLLIDAWAPAFANCGSSATRPLCASAHG
jgi:adenylyltransferase/sulfurtransferase